MKADSRKCSWSFLTERNETAPSILFTLKALKYIKAMVEEHNGEIGFLGLVEERDGSYIITEIFYPKHCLVTSTTCEIAPEGEVEIAQELIDQDRVDDIAKIRFWGHSHHTMGTTPSGQDDTQAIEKMNNNGAYFIRAIANKSNEMSVSFFDHERQLKFENVKWKILVDYDVILANVICATNLASNSEEKIKAIKAAVSDKIDFKGDEEYEAIAKEVQRLKKDKIPPEIRGSVPVPYPQFSGRGRYRQDELLPGFQQDMFEDNWPLDANNPNDDYYQYLRGNAENQKLNGKKKIAGPLLTDQELNTVVNAAWEGK